MPKPVRPQLQEHSDTHKPLLPFDLEPLSLCIPTWVYPTGMTEGPLRLHRRSFLGRRGSHSLLASS